MRALQGFSGTPLQFGSWFLATCRQRLLPWAWDEDETLLLHRWAQEWAWYPALTHPGRPREERAAALAALLAMAHRDCFKTEGELGVWSRLAPHVGIAEGALASGVDTLTHQLDIFRPPVRFTHFVHLIPFLRLVGCPHQALPIIGSRLKVPNQLLPERFKVLIEAKWEEVEDPEAELRSWLCNQTDCPRWLDDADAVALQRDPVRTQRSGSRWRCVELPDDALHVVILPATGSSNHAWRGRGIDQEMKAEDALKWGVPQKLGEDGWIEPVGGPREDLEWPKTPSFWRPVLAFLEAGAVPFEMQGEERFQRVFLPPGWSLDGMDRAEVWRWQPVQGRCPVFAPSGALWNPRTLAQTDLDHQEDIRLADHPELPILFQLPTEIPDLRATPGSLGATLRPGESWTAGDPQRVPPMGHLYLSWGVPGHGRSLEVFVLPTLQIISRWQRTFRVWVMGMESLVGREEDRWYEIPLRLEAAAWTALLDFKGWGDQPLRIQLSGSLEVLGGALRGPLVASSGFSPHSPWVVSPGFFDQTFRDRTRIQFQLPEGVSARMCLEGGGLIWPDRPFKAGQTLFPKEFQDPIEPLLQVLWNPPPGRSA